MTLNYICGAVSIIQRDHETDFTDSVRLGGFGHGMLESCYFRSLSINYPCTSGPYSMTTTKRDVQLRSS